MISNRDIMLTVRTHSDALLPNIMMLSSICRQFHAVDRPTQSNLSKDNRRKQKNSQIMPSKKYLESSRAESQCF